MGELKDKGWSSQDVPFTSEADFLAELLRRATLLGPPVPTRPRGQAWDVLQPKDARVAKPHSLSRTYSTGEFPCHTDTAHWLTPCRYLLFGCVSPGAARRPTILLDIQDIPLTSTQRNLLISTPLRVANGRNSFFSSIISPSGRFIRYDPGCMFPIDADGKAALRIFDRQNWDSRLVETHWCHGKLVIIDNWRILHGRGIAAQPDFDRKLIRVSIQ